MRPLAVLLLAVLALLWAGAARAQESPAAGLASEDPDTVIAAIQALERSGDAGALASLRALRDGTLTVDGKQPSVNNAIRRVLLGAIARLELTADDASVRLAAAEAIESHPTDDDQTAARAALAREHDPKVRAVLAVVVARADLSSSDAELRLAAVRTLREQGGPPAKERLEALVAKRDDGSFAEPDARVRAAAQDALAALARRALAHGALADLFYGASLGSILLLAALGLAISFGLMRVINMAHGEMLMLGAYATYVVQRAFEARWPSHLDAYLVVAVPFAFACCTLVGMALERTVIRFLYGRPLETLLATWGISLVLIETVRLVFGAQNVAVANPAWLSGSFTVLGDVVLSYNRIAVIGFAAVVLAFVWALLNRTRLGLQLRAVTQNRAMAAAIGVPTGRVDTWTFGLGAGVAGLGGVALSQLGNVGPDLGQSYIVDSFLVVVLGGVGRLAGAVAAALGLGVVEKILEPFSGAVVGKIAILVFVILFIQKRPQGLFALRDRAA